MAFVMLLSSCSRFNVSNSNQGRASCSDEEIIISKIQVEAYQVGTECLKEVKGGLLLSLKGGLTGGGIVLRRVIKDIQKISNVRLPYSAPFTSGGRCYLHIVPAEELSDPVLVSLGNAVGIFGRKLDYGDLDLQVVS